MKKKMHKIVGVALTFVLVASLCAFAVPAAADPGANEWDKMVFPPDGKLGSYFRDATITDVGPIAETIDGSFFAWVGGLNNLFKSDDEGRTWTPTKYATAAETADNNIPVIVDIVPSSEDADIVYVASAGVNETTDVAPAVWKSADIFSARAWKTLAEDSLECLLTDDAAGVGTWVSGTDEELTSLDVGYIDGSPFVFVGSAITYGGGVYYLNEAAYGAGWTDLEIDIGADATGIDVLRVACAPGFPDSSWIMAVAAKASNTYVTNNNGTPGTWFDDVELKYGTGPTALVSTVASQIYFPDGFDAVTDYELFVGVSSSTATGAGDVYRVLSTTAYDCNVDDLAANDGFVSLDLIGSLGSTYLIAGEEDAAQAYYSSDDGVTWKKARKTPSGGGETYVLMADDYDESGEAWAATANLSESGGGFSRTVNNGDTWDQISLIATTLTSVADIAFASASDIRFMATTSGTTPKNDCLWKYDGENWERIENRAAAVIESVQCSPEYDSDTTVFFADKDGSAGAMIWRSTNSGGRFSALANDPGATLKGWLVIDSRTLIGTTAGNTFKTENYGRTVWSTGIGDYDLISFAMSPAYEDDETILAGNDAGGVYKSTNAGEKWSGVITGTFGGTGNTYVAFDPDYADNDTFYAAAATAIERYVDEWTSIETDITVTTPSGLACSADGTLYFTESAGVDGVYRSLNPTDPPPYIEWENVIKDIEVNLDSLAVTYGSNILWGVDTDEADVWTYEDTLAVAVVLDSPADGSSSGRQTSCAVTWEALDGAKKYEVKANTREDFKGATVFHVTDVGVAADVITALSSGGTYYWKVRVAETQPTLSKWSEIWSFTTAHGAAQWNPFRGAVNEYPYMGATNVPLKPTFAWNAADWATAYEFELSTGSGTTAGGYFVDVLVGMSGANALVNTVWQCDRDLDYSSTYYWHVRAISAASQSEWATGVFTTTAKPVEVVPPPPPVEIPPAPAPITPAWIWAIVIIGAILVIAVIVLIVTTRRVP